jgi:hypothetical protein
MEEEAPAFILSPLRQTLQTKVAELVSTTLACRIISVPLPNGALLTSQPVCFTSMLAYWLAQLDNTQICSANTIHNIHIFTASSGENQRLGALIREFRTTHGNDKLRYLNNTEKSEVYRLDTALTLSLAVVSDLVTLHQSHSAMTADFFIVDNVSPETWDNVLFPFFKTIKGHQKILMYIELTGDDECRWFAQHFADGDSIRVLDHNDANGQPTPHDQWWVEINLLV